MRLCPIPRQSVNKLTKLVAKAQEILGEEVEAELKQQRLNLIEMILSMRMPNLSQEEVRSMLDLKEADLKKSRFYQEIWQEGRREEAGAMILRLLTRRIGSVSESQRSRISLLSLDRLEDLGEALLDFQNSQDLEKWFESTN